MNLSKDNFVPSDANFEARVRESFTRQKLMTTIGAKMARVAPGEVDIELPFRDDLTQQNGYLHAAVVTAIVDSACGYAAYTLMPADADVLTIEFKANFLSPAKGDLMIARGRVTKSGRNISICHGDVYAISDNQEKLIVTMLSTMMAIRK